MEFTSRFSNYYYVGLFAGFSSSSFFCLWDTLAHTNRSVLNNSTPEYHSWQYYFEFSGVPSSPNGPVIASKITNSSVDLQWTKPSSDGGKPIEAYNVYKQEKGKKSRVLVAKASAVDTKVTVEKLKTDTSYDFFVRAVNEVGESEELSTEKTILIKAPQGQLLLFSYVTFSPPTRKPKMLRKTVLYTAKQGQLPKQ